MGEAEDTYEWVWLPQYGPKIVEKRENITPLKVPAIQ